MGTREEDPFTEKPAERLDRGMAAVQITACRPMPRSTAEELSIESRRTQVAELFLRGVKRQGELARRLSVDRSTISRDLKVLNARWKESAVRDLDAAKGQELERLDLLE